MLLLRHAAFAAVITTLTFGQIVTAQTPAILVGTTQSASTGDLYQRYAEMLKKASKEDLTKQRFSEMTKPFFRIMMTTQSGAQRAGTHEARAFIFPLAPLKSKSFYYPVIKKLLHSKSPYNRILAYMTVGAADDSSFNGELLRAITNETEPAALTFAGSSLLYLNDPHTGELFDFLVKNENFGDAHMLPMMLNQNKVALQNTCYKKLNSPNVKAKILAVQLLASTGLNPQTDRAVRETYSCLKGTYKGFAISAMKTLRMPNLKELLKPEIANPRLRGVIVAALVNSPTLEDQAYADSFSSGTGEVSADILQAYLSSDNPEMVRKFLILVRDRPIPPKFEYQIMFAKDNILSSDALLSQLKDTLSHTKNPRILPFLSASLSRRTDADSVNLFARYGRTGPTSNVASLPDSPEENQKDYDWQLHFNNSGNAYAAKNYPEAAREGEAAVKVAETFKNQDHRLYTTMHNLVMVYQDQKRWSDAERLLKRSLAVARGNAHRTAETYNLLYTIYQLQGKTDLANAMRQQQQKETGVGPSAQENWRTAESKAAGFINQKRYAEAEPYLEAALKIQKRKSTDGDDTIAFTSARLAQVYTFEGKFSLAEPLFKEALAAGEKQRPLQRAELSVIYKMYGQMLQKANRKAESAAANKTSNEVMQR